MDGVDLLTGTLAVVGASLVALAGFVLAAVGFFLNINWVVVGVGLGIVDVGALTGAQMARAGRGQVWE